MSSFTPPSLSVIIAVLAALLAGFLLGRMGREKGDPSDFSRNRSPRPVRPAPSEPAVVSPDLPTEMPPEVLRHLEAGKLINAIKALREAHPGMGLKQAKDAVESYVRRNGLG